MTQSEPASRSGNSSVARSKPASPRCRPQPLSSAAPQGLRVPHLKHSDLDAKTFALQPGHVQSPSRASLSPQSLPPLAPLPPSPPPARCPWVRSAAADFAPPPPITVNPGPDGAAPARALPRLDTPGFARNDGWLCMSFSASCSCCANAASRFFICRPRSWGHDWREWQVAKHAFGRGPSVTYPGKTADTENKGKTWSKTDSKSNPSSRIFGRHSLALLSCKDLEKLSKPAGISSISASPVLWHADTPHKHPAQLASRRRCARYDHHRRQRDRKGSARWRR